MINTERSSISVNVKRGEIDLVRDYEEYCEPPRLSNEFTCSSTAEVCIQPHRNIYDSTNRNGKVL